MEKIKLKAGQRVEIFEKPIWRKWSLGKGTLVRRATPEEYNDQASDENYDAAYWMDLGGELWWVKDIEAFDETDKELIYVIKP